ncbi:MAG TPA: hypothetical protein O0X50_01795, partial [Methanocorpusculum sp.]|nr:hypothetical protein [Methanocorpusculum sp.]
FWQMVQDGTPPETDSSESTTNALKMQYPDSDGTTVDLSPMASALKMRKMLVESYDSIGEQIDGIDNDIRAYMGAAETGTCDGWKISWKSTAGRNTFDSKKFEKDHPGMMAAYQKQGAPYRRYTVKEI